MANNFNYKINNKSRNNSTKSQRQLRVGEELRHLISNALLRETFYDQIIENNTITITEVNVSPDLKIRRSLLEKYSLFTRDIKKRLKDNNYKSIEKKANDLSKTYKKLASLASTDETLNIDQSIDIIFDIYKYYFIH